MNTLSTAPAPNVLILSDHTSFRAHVESWLPAPAFHVLEANEENFSTRAREFPPQLILIDSALDVERCLAQAAALVPGVPFVVISTKDLDPTNPYLFDIAAGFVAKDKERPTRDAVLAAIAKVAPAVASRFK